MKPRSLFTNPTFLALWIGQAVSELGGALGAFCNSLILYNLTGSKIEMGTLWLIYFIPSLLIQLVIGPFIDIWSRKKIMVFSQLSRGLVFLVPIFMLLFDEIHVWNLFVVQFVLGIIQPLYVPASLAISPTLFKKNELTNVNAYIDGTVRLMSILAPTLGGIISVVIGVTNTLYIVCLCFLLSATSLLWVHEKSSENIQVRLAWFKELKGGISYFLNQKHLVWLGFFAAFIQFAVGVTMVLNVPFVTDDLAGSSFELGLFLSGFPAGYLVGSFFVPRIKISENRRRFMLGAIAIGGLSFVLLSFVYEIWQAVVLEIIAGMSTPFFNVHSTSIYQRSVPNEMLGKVFSVRLLIIRSVMPLGVYFGGHFSEGYSVRLSYLSIGCLVFIAAVIGILLPYFKFLEEDTVNTTLDEKFG
ncbi:MULTISPECIES: MFS transporter [Aneurinibacillus]|uniref:MFS transporter n=1 Tax=Aneurinibacillus thermoaerophilus TaxID=143495 RepID=A0A1G8BKK9_ANETH|nr:MULTISPECIES: MFS transporter [Aneurinibacillus]AMA73375.1 permease [Aneurinibacillus sp. XH2]MED0681093.1 MFS transporter [Aneurinibacillus thermoaerophilus]MED0736319.1 MFS transporter [Aneurinibacillus thermoaerophilus]MED0757385.1 MFS transporter [Aneurinibacillus thermoaerophilus]MED0759568.1 MFS transporter [Aneurinibacillus thermoaerophilus]